VSDSGPHKSHVKTLWTIQIHLYDLPVSGGADYSSFSIRVPLKDLEIGGIRIRFSSLHLHFRTTDLTFGHYKATAFVLQLFDEIVSKP
jgi:hypothetical protein